MSKHQSSFSGWPPWLLFLIALLAVGPPSAAIVTFLPTITHNPLLAGGLLLVYEVAVGFLTIISAFVNKIWERRGDSWADAIIGQIEYILAFLFLRYKRRYAEFFYEMHRDLEMKGITIRGAYRLELEQVFVDVHLAPMPPERASSDPLQLPPKLQTGNPTVWDYLGHLNQHLVILGPPGSGKTTLLKHLGLSLVREDGSFPGDKKNFPWAIPVLLTLRDQKEAVSKDSGTYDILQAIKKQVSSWPASIHLTWIQRRLQRGQCLILLDGLDEIADPTERRNMATWVERQMHLYGKNAFVLTSRPLGYRTQPLDGVDILEIQSFTPEKVKQFVHAWYTASEIKSSMRDSPGVRIRAREGAEDLLKRLRETPALYALAVNPLLLTMIATVHLYHGALPGARVALYKAICEVFLSRRQQDMRGVQDLRAEQRQLVLQPLAYSMMQKGIRELSRSEACQILEGPLHDVSLTLTPEEFLGQLEAISSGLLLEREQGVYSFAHLTFQEYLAMVHMQENHLEDELLLHLEESWWHEIIRLFCAQSDATPILEACLSKSLHSLEVLTLAVDCAMEARNVQANVKERLFALLKQGRSDHDPERRRVIVATLLKRRLDQMRSLQGATYVDMSLIKCDEYQLFLDEQRMQGHIHTPDHWKDTTFPSGQEQSPVLGVRLSDAQAFCRWLTARDREGWTYRLPRQNEELWKEQFTGTDIPAEAGYWCEEGVLVWPKGGPPSSFDMHARFLIAHDFPLSQAHTRSLSIDLAVDADLIRTRALTFDSDDARSLARELSYARDLTANRHLDNALAHARNLARTHDSAFAIYVAVLLLSYRIVVTFPVYEGILLIKERLAESNV